MSSICLSLYTLKKLLDKFVYYGDAKARVKEQINDTDYRVSYGKGKSGVMDYAEIIRQLTHTEEEASDKWVIDKS